jgi:hypothetical protein
MPLCKVRGNKVALRSSMGQRWGHIVSVARLIKADVPQRVTRVPEVDEYKPAYCHAHALQIDFKDSLETGQLRKQLPGPNLGATRSEAAYLKRTSTAMVGSIRSLRRARKRASVRSSSDPASLLNPTTSAARMAASFRVSATALLPSATPRLAHRALQLRHAGR